jgi:hypothetical protein
MRRRAVLAHRSQTRQFLNVGRTFQIDDSGWTGPAVVSPDALFLFRFERVYEASPRRGSAASRGLLAIPRDGTDVAQSLAVISSQDLPGLITSHPDWPFPSVRECTVVIVPRERVGAVLYRPGQNSLQFTIGDCLVRVGCEVVDPLTLSGFLRNTGWPTGGRPSSARSGPRMSTFAFLGGAVGLATLAAVSFNSINSQVALLLGLVLSAGAAALVAGAFTGLRK